MKGIRIEIFNLILNKFDGFGFTLLHFSFDIEKLITISNGGSLLHISFRKHFDSGGIEWKFHLNLCYALEVHKVIKTIKPKRNNCWECGELFDHEPFKVDEDGHKFCNKWCSE